SASLIPEQWNHLVVTKGTRLCYYVNGVQVANMSFSVSTMQPNGYARLLMGASQDPNTPGGRVFFFNGSLDDVFIYNRTLTELEIFQLYNENAPTSQPSSQPTRLPSVQPSAQPTSKPSTILSTVLTGKMSTTLKNGLVAFYTFDDGDL